MSNHYHAVLRVDKARALALALDDWVFRSSVTGDSGDRDRYHFRSMKSGFRYRDR
ncbi:hypothetical protein M2244_004116, partial [Rhodoferax antarcticus]|nr:hypothetical protein [Rhodoferax antarcticus]